MANRTCLMAFAAALLAACVTAWAVPPTVSNVMVSRRTDGQPVDIYYDLADPDSATVAVGVRISNDGGATWNKLYAITTSGAIGNSVTPGIGKHIIWDAGTDCPGCQGANYKAQVVASDTGGVYIGEMVPVAAGSFLMGNSGVGDDATYGQAHESPQHSVFLCAYRIGKYEVTRGEYKQFVAAGGYTTQSYWSPDGWAWKQAQGRTHPDYWDAQQTWIMRGISRTFTQTDSHPVVGVTYYEAEAFAKWAGGRLPTEAEWEKAARWNAATNHPNVYPWGDAWDQEKCNNWDDHYTGGYGYEPETTPVGSYPSGASPYGCMDMAGNVSERCVDWYGATYYQQTPEGGWYNPQGPTTGSSRVQRGGSFYYSRDVERSSFRDPYAPNLCVMYVGFRVAR